MRTRHAPLLALALLAGLLVVPLRAGDESGPKPLADRLRETTLTLQVEEMPFAEFVDLLRMQTGINILIDPRIRYDIETIPVTDMVMTDVDLHTVLNLLAHAGGESVTWTLQGGVVLITMHELAPARLDVRIYPVAELVAPRTAFVPEPAGLLGRPRARDEREAAQRYGGADELIELVRGAVEPTFWEETEGADIRTLGAGRLVVEATPAVHQAVLEFLARLENAGPDALRVEVHVVDAMQVATSDPGEALSDRAAAALLAGSAAGPAICLAVRDGVSSTAFAGTRRAYVAAYEPRFAGETTALDPQVDAQELGLAVTVRAVGGGGEGRILLKLGVAISQAAGDRASHAPESPTIDLPGVVRMERESTLLLQPGRWHLAEGRTGGADAGQTAFLVRVTPLDPEPEGPPAATPFLVPTVAPHSAPTSLAGIQIAGLQWDEVDLDQVVAFLRTISGLNFYVTPRVRAEVYDEIQISLHLADVSVQTVLDLVTEPFELTWTIVDDIVVIDRRGSRAPDMALRYYDVKDLTERIVPAARGERARRTTDGDPASRPIYEAEALVELIRETIGSYDMWEDPAAIEARNGILIVRNERHVLDAVDRLLDGLRASVGVVVATVDQLVVDDATVAVLGAAETGGGCPLLLDPAQLQTLEAALTSGAARRLGRERIISVQGSGAPRTTGEEIRYVADYDVRTNDAADRLSPVRRVATLRSGATIDLRTVPGHPGSPVTVELEYERSVLFAMEPCATPHGPIDLPVTDVWRVATGLRIPDGRTAVVAASRAGGLMHLLLVTPRRVALDD